MTTNDSCGSEYRPWVITAKSGQVINLTLVNFDVKNPYEDPERCQFHYGKVRDKNKKQERVICRGENRVSSIYKSIGNQVEIVLNRQEESSTPSRFLIYFESK